MTNPKYHEFRSKPMMGDNVCVECGYGPRHYSHTLPTDENQERDESVKTPDNSIPQSQREAQPNVELPPCPFCKSPAELVRNPNWARTLDAALQQQPYVRCPNGQCALRYINMSVTDWNTCATPAPPVTSGDSDKLKALIAVRDAAQELFYLMARDADGHWCFSSLSRDAPIWDADIQRLHTALAATETK